MNPKTKVFFHGKQIYPKRDGQGKFSSFKTKLGKFIRTVTLVILTLGVLTSAGIGIYKAGGAYNPKIVTEEKEVIVEVVNAPVLERIAKCESGNMHYKNGQVVVNVNSNGSYDMGRYQINSIWNKKATELKLDLTKEEDNKLMAEWIYTNRGTEDWYSSKKCWAN
jgi:hypothetical protein